MEPGFDGQDGSVRMGNGSVVFVLAELIEWGKEQAKNGLDSTLVNAMIAAFKAPSVRFGPIQFDSA
jgi:hypothetical protein